MAIVICQGCGTEHGSWTGRCPKCGNTEIIRLSGSQDRMVDRIIAGRYRIIRKLGQGGMGAVYMGELLGIGQQVALKFLNSNLSQDPDIARRFLNEAKSYARVSHPNAVILHDFGQDEEGNLFISMELVEGIDLKRMLSEQGRIPVAEAIEITLQVADVLGNAHAKGVIHRDLKPENIMVRRGARGLFVKVLDFGIARMIEDGSTRLTIQGAIAGTPRYMAPEQAEGREIDGRADVYSLGMVLLELLTGVHPFDGTTVGEILRKQITLPTTVGEILRRQITLPTPRLKTLAPDLELSEIDTVIQRATAKNPDERYRTMEEFAVDLGRAVPLHLAKTASSLSETEPAGDRTFVRQATDASATAPADTGVSVAGQTGLDVTPSSFPIKRVLGAASLLVLLVAAGYYALGHRTQPQSAAAAGGSQIEPKQITDPKSVAGNDPKTINNPQKPDEPRVDLKLSQQILWDENYIRARNAFIEGRLDVARDMLKGIPDEFATQDVKQLLANLEEITSKLARAKALSAAGECAAAIPVYEEILRAYPKQKEAKDGRSECRRRLPPSQVE